ncbi:helix-turn-helix domain-containing protein [Gandjariella thermophila]|uniref:Insertion element IS150 protein InsJ-like helix-turn-helix domain-containing protein n=1 Tax=Gandjariella thermophila TaxID=1931992 RepID=A0A4D4JH23_9PSEU|nr:helix-turn-helix domain-containing protein [Gandjariella thermophila]GDY33696.1 hypothetical protein GTS_53290 [Gandjariella thermophila]
MIKIKDARGLPPAALEVLRLRVVAALESGKVRGYRRTAEMFGVSQRSVGSWWRAYRDGGREALAVRRSRRPGPRELVSAEERAVLFQAIADYSPRSCSSAARCGHAPRSVSWSGW